MSRHLFGLIAVLFIVEFITSAVGQTRAYTSTGMKESQEKTLKDEDLGIIPQIGILSFTDKAGSKDGRQLSGLGIDFNFTSLFKNDVKDYYFGISTGVFYSHVGASGSNFFGSSNRRSDGGANLLMMPIDAKIGYNFTSYFRGSVRGGSNLIYRSIANLSNLGDGSGSLNSLWKMYPNVGADFEFQVGRSVGFIVRPDLTIAPNNNLFMGTVGATIIMSL